LTAFEGENIMQPIILAFLRKRRQRSGYKNPFISPITETGRDYRPTDYHLKSKHFAENLSTTRRNQNGGHTKKRGNLVAAKKSIKTYRYTRSEWAIT